MSIVSLIVLGLYLLAILDEKAMHLCNVHIFLTWFYDTLYKILAEKLVYEVKIV